MLKLWMFVLFIFSSVVITAQGGDINSKLTKNFKAFQLSRIDYKDLNKRSSKNSYDVKLNIPSPEAGLDLQLDLYKINVVADDYILTVYDGNEATSTEGLDLEIMTGNISGRPESRAYAVVGRSYFFAYIDDGKEQYYYEPLSFYGADPRDGEIVIYKDEDVKPTAGTCGSKLYHQHNDSKREVTTTRAGDCYFVDYAVASDYEMYRDFGNSVSQVEAFVVSITGLMNGDYDTSFDDELVHTVVQNVVSTSAGGDEWLQGGNPASIDELLDEFTAWGPNNLVSHDVASLWTGFDLSGNTIGLAWLGVVCNNFRYNVLEHYTNNTTSLRVLTSHELGHNYNASHDSGGGFIMSPSINNTSAWSSQSINAINAYYSPRAGSCFESCGGGSGGNPPNANFDYDITEGCAPGQVQFTDASTQNPTSWSWTFQGGVPATSSDRNPVVSYAQSGAYDVTLTVTNIDGTDNITRRNLIVIYDDPISSFVYQVSGNQASFENQSIDAESYLWDFGNGQTSTSNNPVIVYNDPGSYTVSLTATNACGSDVSTANVVIEGAPEAAFTASDINICEGESITFTDVSIGDPTSRLWTFEGGTPSSSTSMTQAVQYLSGGRYDVSLSVSNAIGTDVETVSNYITVSSRPLADFSFQVSGNEVTFNNGSINASEFDWDFDNGQTSTLIDPVITFNEPGSYTVSLLASNGCGNDDISKTVVIESPLEAAFSASEIRVCSGQSVTFSDISTGNPTSRLWTFEGGTPQTSSAENPTVLYQLPGNFDVTLSVSDENGSDSEAALDYIRVIDAAIADFNYVINGGEVVFENLSLGASSFTWSFGDGNTSTDSNPVHVYQEAGTYTVQLEAENECSSDRVISDITIQFLPVSGINIEGSTEICEGASIQFIENASTNVESYFWEFEGGTPTTSSDPNPVVEYMGSGIFDVSLTVTNALGSDTETLENVVTVSRSTEADFTYSLDGGTITFQSQSVNADDHLWDFGDGNISSLEDPSHIYQEDGTYDVSLEVNGSCGMDVRSETIEVLLPPVAVFNVIGSGDVCVGTAISVENLSQGNNIIYQWSSEGASIDDTASATPTFTYNEGGDFSISLTVTNDSGSDTYTLENAVSVIETVTSEVSHTKDGLQVNFVNNSAEGDHFWDFGDGTTSNVFSPIHNYEVEGIYQVVHTVSNACGSDDSTIELNLFTIPDAAFSIDVASGCAPLQVKMNNESSDNSDEFLWMAEGAENASSEAKDPTFIYNQPGTYDILLITSNPAGADTAIMIDAVTILDVVEADFSFTKDLLSVSLSAINDNGDDYNWDLGDGNTASGLVVNHTYNTEGIFQVTLNVTNSCGKTSVTKEVVINDLPSADFDSSLREVCAGASIQFTENASSNTSGYQWYFEGGSPQFSNDPNPIVEYSIPGAYDVQLIVSGVAGADTLMKADHVLIGGPPVLVPEVEIEGNLIIIENKTQDIISSSFILGNDTISGDRIEYAASRNGMVRITMMGENECGFSTETIETEIDVFPSAALDFVDVLVCSGDAIPFPVKEIREGDQYEWTVYNQDTSISENGVQPIIELSETGTYDLKLVVSNQYGADSAQIERLIEVIDVVPSDFEYEIEDNAISAQAIIEGDYQKTWNMGDGTILEGMSIEHIYQEDGIYEVVFITENQCGIDSASIVVEVLTSFVTEGLDDQFRVYPNPASEFVTLDYRGNRRIQVQVLDINGRPVNGYNPILFQSMTTMNVTDLPPATYLLKIVDQTQIIYHKLVVVK
jgi:PKD repeat protein